MEGHNEEPDNDHDFFKCIPPSVQVLKEYQKINFRMKVSSILQNYNLEHSDHFTSPQTFSSVLTPSRQHYAAVFQPNYLPSVVYTHPQHPLHLDTLITHDHHGHLRLMCQHPHQPHTPQTMTLHQCQYRNYKSKCNIVTK